MTKQLEKNPIIELYGEGADLEAIIILNELRKESNFEFDPEYIKGGISFLHINCQKVLDGELDKRSLKKLMTKSFGEAAICKFNG